MIYDTRERQHWYDNFLRFHEDLLNIQVKNMQHLIAVISFRNLNKIDLDSRIQNGGQIITSGEILIDEKDLEHIFDSILPVLRRYSQNKKALSAFEDFYDKRKISLTEMIENVVTRDITKWNEMSQRYSIPENFLIGIGEYIAMPYLELCSEYFNKRLKNGSWLRPSCPICGSSPSMALLQEDLNERILWCHLCDTEWRFSDKVCPFCENQDLSSIKHIFPPVNSPHRIDACDKCGYFLKIIDDQLITKYPKFVIENLRTIKLEQIAINKGYKPFHFMDKNALS
ncbi:formate dehydrogenase accessory protein FdhE [candidate division KSB1 bacterium]|nr:formate dehydrogenase accessory protein FdhE [candidate division KSB1 bacterium]